MNYSKQSDTVRDINLQYYFKRFHSGYNKQLKTKIRDIFHILVIFN